MTGWLNKMILHSAACAGTLLAAECAVGQCTSSQSCLVVHGPGGCNSTSCCTLVCGLDPTCCAIQWDADCVSIANTQCVGYCGAAASGSCLAPHANPSCDNGDCCGAVCAFDPFCCSSQWDVTCVQLAGFACSGNPGTCGQVNEGCFTPHAQGACDDLACCNAVCMIDPTCCSQSWDLLCVYTAEQTCVAACQPVAEPDAELEAEKCGARLNDPCYSSSAGSPETMLAAIQKSGTLGTPSASIAPDVDVYAVTVPDPDGDGLAKVSLRFSSSPVAWAALVPASACAPIASSVVHLGSNLCVDTATPPLCIPSGQYRIVVSGGVYPTFAGADITCASTNGYTVKLEVAQTCAACATSTDSCFAPHNTPGCAIASCCAPVCAADPFCCDEVWDTECALRAGNSCAGSPPVNDACKGAVALAGDSITVNTAGSTAGSIQIPSCPEAAVERDVWISYEGDVGGAVTLETCGSWFDTVVSVYRGSCGAPELIACDDDTVGCGGNGASRVTFDSTCGERYLFRVGPKTGPGGEVIVSLLRNGLPGCTPCLGDLNDSGAVDAQDISILLNGWGTASGDVNGDGTTDAQDISMLLNGWGPCL